MPQSLQNFVDDALTRVKEIPAEDVLTLIGKNGTLILDVREKEEYDAGHLKGALNIPRGNLEVKADLEHHKRDPRLADRNQAIVCYCGGGFRSALSADVLVKMGFSDVQSMAGGWSAWKEHNFPIETS